VPRSASTPRRALTLLPLLAACAARAPHPVAAVPVAGDHYVLVDPDAAFYTAPSLDAERVRSVASAADGERLRAGGHFLVHRLIAERGDFVEVETLAASPWSAHCHGDLESLRGLRLRLHVRREALAPVITRPVRVAFADGTAISLAPGVGLRPLPGTGISAVTHDQISFALRVPDDAVGDRYVPGAHFATDETEREIPWDAARRGALHYGGSARLRVAPLPVGALFVYASREVPGAAIATLQSPCARYEVRVDPSAIVPYSPLGGLVGGLLAGPPPFAVAGAPLWFRSGAPAGRAVDEVGFDGETERAGARRCFRKAFGFVPKNEPPGSERFLTLCVDPANLRQ
jgi:hypothetical protein